MQALVIEDEPLVQILIKTLLKKNGYGVTVAGTAKKAQKLAFKNANDVIILDLNLPDGNGFDICKNLRQHALETPVLILSGDQETDTKIKCLNAGADDYLTKPFNKGELIARLKAITRRKTDNNNRGILNCEELEVNLIEHVLTINGTEVQLHDIEFNLLSYLMKRENTLVSTQALTEELQGESYNMKDTDIKDRITNLKDKISEHAKHQYIKELLEGEIIFRDPLR